LRSNKCRSLQKRAVDRRQRHEKADKPNEVEVPTRESGIPYRMTVAPMNMQLSDRGLGSQRFAPPVDYHASVEGGAETHVREGVGDGEIECWLVGTSSGFCAIRNNEHCYANCDAEVCTRYG